MLAEYKTKTNVFVGLGFLLQLGGRVMAMQATEPVQALAGLGAVVLGAVLFIVGCCFYAMAKGYSGALGLLGLLSCLGLIVLVVLPDKHKE